MATAAALLGALLFWADKPSGPYFWGAGVLFLGLGLFKPRMLTEVERTWMRVADLLGTIMTTVILTAVFVLIVNPIALISRIIRKDSLNCRFDPKASTYWMPVDPNGPSSRPGRPFYPAPDQYKLWQLTPLILTLYQTMPKTFIYEQD